MCEPATCNSLMNNVRDDPYKKPSKETFQCINDYANVHNSEFTQIYNQDFGSRQTEKARENNEWDNKSY